MYRHNVCAICLPLISGRLPSASVQFVATHLAGVHTARTCLEYFSRAARVRTLATERECAAPTPLCAGNVKRIINNYPPNTYMDHN